MRMLYALLLTILSGPLFADPHIDASTQESFTQSFEAMKGHLPSSKAAELDAAVASLPFAGMRSVKDTPPDGIVKLDIKTLDGMTADQIIELAHKTVSVKISVGPPPGLPKQYSAQLFSKSANANASMEAPSLAGTAWDLTSNLNGNISHEHVVLRNGGIMDDGTVVHGRWEQLGAQVKMAFNDNYAVYLGSVDGPTSLKGSAANINGSEWTWTAQRSNWK